MKRGLIFAGIILALSILIFGLYQYNKPHRDIASSAADYRLSADELFLEFEKNRETASSRYVDKVITFSGIISTVQQNQTGGYNILLKGRQGSVNCEIDPTLNLNIENLLENTLVNVKGLCVGSDDLLQELQFKKCNIMP